ncbi:FAD-binding protein [Bacillus velezensis]|uniref:FAD-binding protein n=1 Tax=Bacillus velezensis TaxID=492670 RepID=UPI003C6C6A2C
MTGNPVDPYSGRYQVGASDASGWFQGGGHSPASRDYGLGADQILEAEVVLANGEIITANSCHNQDIYFAIRGGGGGTYGVVVSTIIKAYPTTSISAQTLAVAPLTDADIPVFRVFWWLMM